MTEEQKSKLKECFTELSKIKEKIEEVTFQLSETLPPGEVFIEENEVALEISDLEYASENIEDVCEILHTAIFR